MRIEERAAALIALVESDRSSRMREIVEPAQNEARTGLARARREAKARVATAVAEERAAYRAKVAAAEARLATARRMVRQRRLKAFAAEGWQCLPAALTARWADGAACRAWIDAAIGHAVAVLPAGAWVVEGPAQWSEAERRELTGRMAERGIDCRCAAIASIDAGLRIASRNVEVDATAAGLAAEHAAVEGRMLHHFEGNEA